MCSTADTDSAHCVLRRCRTDVVTDHAVVVADADEIIKSGAEALFGHFYSRRRRRLSR